jgi:hypothetical protein
VDTDQAEATGSDGGDAGGSGAADDRSTSSASDGAETTEDSPEPTGNDEPGPGDYEPGSRLEFEWLHPIDGPDQLLGIFDTELGLRCAFQPAADGALRCLPATYSTGLGYDPATGAGAPSLQGNTGCSPTLVTAPRTSPTYSCDPVTYEVFSVGVAQTGVCISWTGAGCSSWYSVDDDAPAGASLYLLTEPVDLDTFVTATLETPTDAGRLVVQRLVADDGLRMPWALYDTGRNTTCTSMTASDGQLRCLPPTTPAIGHALDESAGVWVPYAAGNENCAPPIASVVPQSPFACTPAETMLLEAIPAPEVCLSAYPDGQCMVVYQLGDGYPDGATYFMSGDEIDPSQFVALARAQRDTGRRLVEQIVRAEGGQEMVVGLHDTERGIDCAFSRTSSGEYRCLPTTWAAGHHYTGSAAVPFVRASQGCEPEFIAEPAELPAFSCETPTTEVSEIGEIRADVCLSWSGGCSYYGEVSGDDPAGAAFYLAGAPASPVQFAGATVE